MSFLIRPIELRDVSRVREVAEATWHCTYDGIYPRSFITGFLEQAYSLSSLEQAVLSDQNERERHFFVADCNEEIVGYTHVKPIRNHDYELLRIYVLPAVQRHGLGTLFLQELTKQITGMNQLTAWVESGNQAGRAFYERQGFKIEHEKIEHAEGMEIHLIGYSKQMGN